MKSYPAVALFTGALVWTSWRQWQAIGRQGDIADKALVLQYRQELIVRNVVIDEPNTIPRPPLFQTGMPVKGQFYISNVGGTSATITEAGCWVEWLQILPMKRPYEAKNGNVTLGSNASNQANPLHATSIARQREKSWTRELASLCLAQALGDHKIDRSRFVDRAGAQAGQNFDALVDRLDRVDMEYARLNRINRLEVQHQVLLFQRLKERLTHVEALAPHALGEVDGAQPAARLIEDQTRQQGRGIELFGALA